ncbi:MAG: hypothetical protein ABJA66_04355 [Actinomycetota bacterium]
MCGSLLWMASCGIISRNSSSRGSGEEPLPAAEKPATAPFERELPLTSPRTLKYANLQYTVTKAVISNRAAADLPIDNSNSAVADITFSVVNTLKDAVRIESGLWELRLGDGSVYKKPYSENFDPRDTKERKISFRVPPNAQWNGAQLTLDEQNKEPALLSLDGNGLMPQYPIQLATGGQTSTKEPQMIYTIQNASVDLDAFGERAELGKHYLNLTIHVADKEAGDNGEFLPEFFRLLVDGVPLLPKATSDNFTVAAQSSQDYTMAYLIPATAASIELEVGKPEVQTTAKIPIDLKKEMPQGFQQVKVK